MHLLLIKIQIQLSRKGDPGFDDDDVDDGGIGDVLEEVFDADEAIDEFGMDDEEF